MILILNEQCDGQWYLVEDSSGEEGCRIGKETRRNEVMYIVRTYSLLYIAAKIKLFKLW